MLTVALPVPSFAWTFPIPFHFLGSNPDESPANRQFKLILWQVIGGTRGGVTRAKILRLIGDAPLNTNQISKIMDLDYKAIMHHLRVLTKNGFLVREDRDYGAEYSLSQIMRDNQGVLEEIMKKIGTK